MGISAIIHTYNSEKYLDECLQALISVDEIVVCDMYSTDRTIEIAKKYDCKIVYHENIGFVEPARNFAISHATQEWILIVDSDEIIPQQLIEHLRETVRQPDCPDMIFISRKNILLGKVLWSWYPNSILRFFRKGVVTFNDFVHCMPTLRGRKVYKIDPKKTDLAIIHYNYDSLESFISRMNKYTTLELEKFKKRGIKFSVKFLLARSFGEFIKRYFLKGGFKDGLHGFIFAIMMGIYKFVAIAKLWEYELKQAENSCLEKECKADAVTL